MNIGAVLSHYDYPVYGYETSILCPFHDDHHPSCRVNMENGLFCCDACHAGGTLVELVAGIEQTTLLLAHLLLISLPDIDKPVFEKQRKRKNKEQDRLAAFDFYNHLPYINWDLQQDHYLLKRDFIPETLHHFGVKDNNTSDHPVVIPLTEQGKFVGYVTRRIDDERMGKYKNNFGFSRATVLEGDLEPGIVLLVEGKLCQMKVWQYGWKNTACLLGSEITDEQAEKLARIATRVVCALDNSKIDPAGKKGTEQVITKIEKRYGIPVDIFPYPDERKAPDELTQQEFATQFLSLFPKL